MGIQGLLPFLKKLHTPVNIAQFQGQTAAIDAYCWLHKGAFSCAEKLALGEPTEQYVVALGILIKQCNVCMDHLMILKLKFKILIRSDTANKIKIVILFVDFKHS